MQAVIPFKNILLAAVIAALWILAAVPRASASTDFQISASSDLTMNLTHVAILWGDDNILNLNQSDYGSAFDAGPSSWPGLVFRNLPDDTAQQSTEMLALTPDNDVVVFFSAADAPNYVGQPWPFTTDESSIEQLLAADDPNIKPFLEKFKQEFGPQTVAKRGDRFSLGVDVGPLTLDVEPLPEPTSLVFVAMTAALLPRRRFSFR